METSIKNCPRCQAPIPQDAPHSLCPQCLLASVSAGTEAETTPRKLPPPELAAVAKAFPQLEIIEFVGQGGMGFVYRARQAKLDRLVALKLLPRQPGADPSFGERFHREARVLARLNHPNIVAVHDFGQTDEFWYLVMEFVDGVNLRQALRHGPFSPAQALSLVPKICEALQFAHDEGVLHRDIKPENLLLDARGRVKIADFGIAKLLGEAPQDITLTGSGAAVGTPHYMAPEQFERPKEVDQRADLFSLGVVFYEMLTGELPLGRFALPSQKSAVDPRIDEVVLRALERERERRFQSAGEIKTQVEHITANPAAARPGPPPIPPAAPRSWSLPAIASVLLVAFSLFAVLLLITFHRDRLLPVAVLCGLTSVVGIWLGRHALESIHQSAGKLRGRRLALAAAAGYPFLLIDLLLFSLVVVVVGTLDRDLFGNNRLLTGFAAILTAAGLLIWNGVVVSQWRAQGGRGWPSLLPPAAAKYWQRVPRVGAWVLLPILLFASLVLMPVWLREGLRRRLAPHSYSSRPMTGLSAVGQSAGYEIPNGASPEDERSYQAAFRVPAGYVLTLVTTLGQGELIVQRGHVIAVVTASATEPASGRLSWRLLGNRLLADGAPLEFKLSLDQAEEKSAKTFHLTPPESVTVNWVGEPPQIWPPLAGRTKYLLVKGTADSPGDETTEWGVGIELRLEPLSAAVESPATPTITLKDESIQPSNSLVPPLAPDPPVSPTPLLEPILEPASLSLPE